MHGIRTFLSQHGTFLFDPQPELLQPFIDAAEQLEQDGVAAITGSCGFLARLQAELAAAVEIPVFVTSGDLDALLLECTDLSAFSHQIQQATNIPVYDINSLVEYVAYSVSRKQYI